MQIFSYSYYIMTVIYLFLIEEISTGPQYIIYVGAEPCHDVFSFKTDIVIFRPKYLVQQVHSQDYALLFRLPMGFLSHQAHLRYLFVIFFFCDDRVIGGCDVLCFFIHRLSFVVCPVLSLTYLVYCLSYIFFFAEEGGGGGCIFGILHFEGARSAISMNICYGF